MKKKTLKKLWKTVRIAFISVCCLVLAIIISLLVFIIVNEAKGPHTNDFAIKIMIAEHIDWKVVQTAFEKDIGRNVIQADSINHLDIRDWSEKDDSLDVIIYLDFLDKDMNFSSQRKEVLKELKGYGEISINAELLTESMENFSKKIASVKRFFNKIL